MGILIDSALKRQLEVPAVYARLIFAGLALSKDTARDIEKCWQVTAKEIDVLYIRSCPSEILNLIATHSCLEHFGSDVLGRIPGVYAYSRNPALCSCLEWRSDCICKLWAWRLDLDPQLCRRGFILPVTNACGWFTELWVYRHARDLSPFLLQTRRKAVAA